MGDANLAVFRWINGWPEWMASTMRFLSTATDHLWFKVALGVLVLLLVFLGGAPRRAAVQALIAFPLADGTTNILKHLFPLNRPFADLTPSQMYLRIGEWPRPGEHPSFGTASAHSANMAAVAFVFAYHLGWRGSAWIPIAVLVGLSRIYNGAHYPYQVLLGWTCGIVAALVVTKAWEGILRWRKPVGPNEGAVQKGGAPDA